MIAGEGSWARFAWRVTKTFGEMVVLQSTDLHIADGEFTVLVGPSGPCKSTLLRPMVGLEVVSGGRIEIGGADVTARGRAAGASRWCSNLMRCTRTSAHQISSAFSMRRRKIPCSHLGRTVPLAQNDRGNTASAGTSSARRSTADQPRRWSVQRSQRRLRTLRRHRLKALARAQENYGASEVASCRRSRGHAPPHGHLNQGLFKFDERLAYASLATLPPLNEGCAFSSL